MGERRTVQATATSFDIVEALLAEGAAGVTTLSRKLDIPKSTVHKHLATLSDLGYVEKAAGTYALSVEFAGLGLRTRRTRPLYERSETPINRLAESTEEHAGIYVATGTTGFDLYSSYGPRALLDDVDQEPSQFLHCTAAGKAILANVSSDRLDTVIEAGLPALTADTIDSGPTLRTEVARVRKRGVAFDRGEQSEAIRSVAMPLNLEGVDAAVYVTAPVNRMRGKRLEENIPGLLSNTVKRIEAKL